MYSSISLVLAALLVPVTGYPATSSEPSCSPAPVFEQATTLLHNKQFDQAYRMLQTLRPCPALSPLERFQLGWLYGRSRHFEEALKEFHSVPASVPDTVTHQYAIALSEFELSHYDRAVAALSQLKEHTPLDPKCSNLLGVSYSKLGQYEKAYATFDEVIRRYPNDLAGYLNQITLCVDGGNLEKAAALAVNTTHAFPQSSQAYLVLGAANLSLGRLDAAHANFTTAIQLAPSEADPRFYEALTSYKQDKLDAAVNELDDAQRGGVSDSDLHYLKAECLIRRDPANTKAVLSELDRALELNPDSVSAHVLRGKLELSAGEKEKALRDLESAHKTDPQSRSATYNLARTYQSLGRRQEAKPLFQQVSQQAADPLSELSNQRLNSTLKGDSAR